ncbi:PAC2 family protein [Nocardioides dubius]|uniref:PAC2 family protein n=1 Tax=Nocardioides dubius TaxID=317019 RepID=A0ABN1TPF0_9ACTN
MRYVHIVDDVADDLDPDDALPLVIGLDGFLDAGRAATLLTDHLVDQDPGPVVATFDIDSFHDYRARRPAITFEVDHYRDYEAPRIVVRLMDDSDHEPFLLMTGPEPDMRWEAFAEAVGELIGALGVSKVLTLDSVPMAAPHTRPLMVTRHANMEGLRSGLSMWKGELRVPASVHAMLAIRLGERGIPVQGLVLHVPHYLAQFDFNDGAIALGREIDNEIGLNLNTYALLVDAKIDHKKFQTYLGDNPEVGEIVAGLEAQYDRFQHAESAGLNLLADKEDLPSGDEIGAEFERFLAGLDGPENQE